MAIAEDAEAGLAAKFAVMRELLDERQWRVYLGTEARALGRGGVAAVARASGASQVTVAAGGGAGRGPGARWRPWRGACGWRPGAGLRKAEDAQPGLRQALGGVLEEATRGDPVSEVTWCSLSLRDLRPAAGGGGSGAEDAIARMLRQEGYSLQAMAKVLEARQHPDRDGQFRHVNAMIRAFRAAGYPVVSADAKKKEKSACITATAARGGLPRPGRGLLPRLPRPGAGQDHPLRGSTTSPPTAGWCPWARAVTPPRSR